MKTTIPISWCGGLCCTSKLLYLRLIYIKSVVWRKFTLSRKGGKFKVQENAYKWKMRILDCIYSLIFKFMPLFSSSSLEIKSALKFSSALFGYTMVTLWVFGLKNKEITVYAVNSSRIRNNTVKGSMFESEPQNFTVGVFWGDKDEHSWIEAIWPSNICDRRKFRPFEELIRILQHL